MDIAIEKFGIGNVRRVTAIQLANKGVRTIHIDEKRFFCTECGEYVGFSNSESKAPYFYHGKALDGATICDLRVDINGDYSIYEKLGSQLFIEKLDSNLFNLRAGFYSLKDSLLLRCAEKKYSIVIESTEDNNRVKYRIDESRFQSGSKTYLDINFFARKYQINYSNYEAENLLKKNWGTSIEGFQNSCVFFSCHNEGGKKININEEIETNTDYYLVCSSIPYQLKKHTEIQSTGIIEFSQGSKYKRMNVYKLHLIVKNDQEFIRLHEFVRSFFKLSLVKKAKEISVLWPPCIELFDESIFINKYEKAAIVLNSIEKSSEIYSHLNNNSLIKRADAVGQYSSLFGIYLYTSDTALSINGKYSPINRVLKLHNKTYTRSNNILFSLYNDTKLISEEVIEIMPRNREIKVVTNSRIRLIHYRSDVFHREYQIKNIDGVVIKDLEYNDKVVARQGLKEVLVFRLQRQKELKNKIINENLIINQIRRNSQGKLVPVPIWIKQYITILNLDSELRNLIRKYILINKIPINVIRILQVNRVELRGINE